MTHLTLPALRAGPLPLPPLRGRRGRLKWLSNEPVLRAPALGDLAQRLPRDQRLEVVVLLVLGKRRLVLEDLVEEELLRLAERLVDLEGLHTRLALSLRQEALQDLDHGIDLAGLGFPEGRDDETIVDRMKIGHVLSPWWV